MKDNLTVKAASLARSSPNEWREFLAELAVYCQNRVTECVQSPIEMVHVAQGRAQQCTSLLALLNDAVKNADRLADRK